jgi:hypothetical protein
MTLICGIFIFPLGFSDRYVFSYRLKVRVHAHDSSDKPRTSASVANKLMLATPFSLPGLLIRLIGFGKSEYLGVCK